MKPTVVLTRPAGDSDTLHADLTRVGYSVRVQPVMKIVPIEPDSISPLPDLPDDGFAIFISANAATIGGPLLLSALKTHRYTSLAVGAKTAQALAKCEIEAVVPDLPSTEGLLALPELQILDNRTVVIVKGEGGRGLLAETLRERGATVHEFACYRRQPEPVDGEVFAKSLDLESGLVFQANSGETLELLTNLLSQCSEPNLLLETVVVPSERVADLAVDLGWQRVKTASDAGDDAFIAVLDDLATAVEDNIVAVTDDNEENKPAAEVAAVTGHPREGDSAEGDSAVAEPLPAEPEEVPSMADGATSDGQTEAVDESDVSSESAGEVTTPPATVVTEPAGDKAKAPPPPPKPPGPGKVKRSDWFARLLALLALVALGAAIAAGYLFLWPDWLVRANQSESLTEQLAAFEADFTAREAAFEAAVTAREAASLAKLNGRLGDVESSAKALRQELRANSERQGSQLAEGQRLMTERVGRLELKLERLMATDRRAWLANEAAFLVRLAAQRLLASRDVAAAEALLTNADALLSEADDPRLEAARRAVVTDRMALKAAERVDIVGLYAKLSALAGQAGALAVVADADTRQTQLSETASWLERAEAGWQAALAKLSDYLIIRRRDAEMARLMTPDWEALARQNLRMLIEQAQIAALSGNQVLFDTALERARLFVSEFASTDPDRARGMLEEIDALAATNIAPELPDLLGSRSAIVDAIRLLNGERNDQLQAPRVEG